MNRDRKTFTINDGLRIQLRKAMDEREVLLEEIRQLRASVLIYAELVRRLEKPAA